MHDFEGLGKSELAVLAKRANIERHYDLTVQQLKDALNELTEDNLEQLLASPIGNDAGPGRKLNLETPRHSPYWKMLSWIGGFIALLSALITIIAFYCYPSSQVAIEKIDSVKGEVKKVDEDVGEMFDNFNSLRAELIREITIQNTSRRRILAKVAKGIVELSAASPDNKDLKNLRDELILLLDSNNIDASSIEAELARAAVALSEGDTQRALEFLDESLEKRITDKRQLLESELESSTQLTIEFLMLRGNAKLKSALFEDALEDFSEVTRLDPQNWSARIMSTQCLHGDGQIEKAVCELELLENDARNVRPKDLELISKIIGTRGRSNWALGDYSEAMNDFSNAINIDRKTHDEKGLAVNLSDRSLLFENLRKMKDGKRDIVEAIEICRKNISISDNIFWQVVLANSLNNAALIARWNDLSEAELYLAESAEILRGVVNNQKKFVYASLFADVLQHLAGSRLKKMEEIASRRKLILEAINVYRDAFTRTANKRYQFEMLKALANYGGQFLPLNGLDSEDDDAALAIKFCSEGLMICDQLDRLNNKDVIADRRALLLIARAHVYRIAGKYQLADSDWDEAARIIDDFENRKIPYSKRDLAAAFFNQAQMHRSETKNFAKAVDCMNRTIKMFIELSNDGEKDFELSVPAMMEAKHEIQLERWNERIVQLEKQEKSPRILAELLSCRIQLAFVMHTSAFFDHSKIPVAIEACSTALKSANDYAKTGEEARCCKVPILNARASLFYLNDNDAKAKLDFSQAEAFANQCIAENIQFINNPRVVAGMIDNVIFLRNTDAPDKRVKSAYMLSMIAVEQLRAKGFSVDEFRSRISVAMKNDGQESQQ